MIGRRGFITGAVLLAAGAADAQDFTGTSSGSLSISKFTSCWLATISMDHKDVVIDWKCVAEQAQLYRDGKTKGATDAFAHVLQSIHDGEAKSR